MLKKCRNDVLKYGYDSRKNDSVMACFVRGGVKAHPPAAFIPFYRLQLIGLIKNTSVVKVMSSHISYHIKMS